MLARKVAKEANTFFETSVKTITFTDVSSMTVIDQ